MIPWNNSWFQLAAAISAFTLCVLLFDLSRGRSSSPAAGSPAGAPPPSSYNPPPSQEQSSSPAPAYNPPSQPSQPSYSNPPNPGGEGMVVAPGVFSYQAPPGWRLIESRISPFKVAVGERKDNVTQNISMHVEQNAQPLNEFVYESAQGLSRMSGLTNVRVYNQQPFTTNSGVPGIRIVITATRNNAGVMENTYFYDGGNQKIVMAGGCLLTDGATVGPLFDASAKSLTLLR